MRYDAENDRKVIEAVRAYGGEHMLRETECEWSLIWLAIFWFWEE